MDAQTKTALRARIDDAFAASTYPGDDKIGFTRPGCVGHEGNLVADFFKGKDWRAITFAGIVAGYDAPINAIPAFMQPDGLAYFLPAFLCMALDLEADGATTADNEAETLDDFVDSLCFLLAAPSPNSLSEQYDLVKDMAEVPEEVKANLRNPSSEAKAAEAAIVENHRRLVGLLSEKQHQVVAEVLHHVAACFRWADPDDEFNTAIRALESTWG